MIININAIINRRHNGDCLLLNCQGLTQDKEQTLYQYLRSSKPLIVVLIETHKSSHRWSAPKDYHVYDIPGMNIGDNQAPRISGGIALFVRNDCTAVAPLPRASFPGFNVTEPFNIPDISSQWNGWNITVDGWPRPLVIIPIYLQFRVLDKHRQEQAPLYNQLDLLIDYLDGIAPDDQPWTLLCGDFNNHAPELGSPTSDRINVVRELLQRGFTCHNNNYCYGTPTHKKEGILDLLLEYPPAGEQFIIESMRVCSEGEIGPLFSDHFPVLFSLRHSPPPPQVAAPRMVWDTEKASDAQVKSFVDGVQCALDRPLSDDEWEASNQLDALLRFRARSDVDQKAEALSLVDNALGSVVNLLCDVGSKHVKRRAVSDHNQPDWSPGLKELHRAMADAHKWSMRRHSNAYLASKAQRAREAFNDAFTAVRRDRFASMKAMVEEELELDHEHPKHRVAWKAVKRYSKFTQPRASSIRAGLKKADGSSTTSVRESQVAPGRVLSWCLLSAPTAQ